MKQQSIASHFQQIKLHSPKDFAFDTPESTKTLLKNDIVVPKLSLDISQTVKAHDLSVKKGKNDAFNEYITQSTATSTKKRVVAPKMGEQSGKKKGTTKRGRKTVDTLVINQKVKHQSKSKKRKIQGKFQITLKFHL